MDQKSQFKVLVVEDEFFTAKYLCEELKDLNVDPLNPVPKGELAVEVALKELPDLILMDIRLAGGMDGIEAAKKIQESKYIPVIFMSAFATDYIVERAKGVTYIDFFEKPINMDMLSPIIDGLRKSNSTMI